MSAHALVPPVHVTVTPAPVPTAVTQETSLAHFGVPPRAFVRMARNGVFEAKKVGRLWIAPFRAVCDALAEPTPGPAAVPSPAPTPPPVAPAPPPGEPESLADRVRRDLARTMATGPREVRRGKRANG